MNGKDELYNAIIDYLVNKNAGFTLTQAADMEMFMDILSKTLWTLDGQYQKLLAAPRVSSVPCFLAKSFRKIEHKGMIKKAVPNMKLTELIAHATKLEILLSKKLSNQLHSLGSRKTLNNLVSAP